MKINRYWWRVGLLGFLIGITGACGPGSGGVPWPTIKVLVDDSSVAGTRESIRREALGRGRSLYHGKCVRCHAPVAMNHLPPGEWPSAISRMSLLSRLSPEQEADLAGYVEASLQKMVVGEETGSR